MIKTFLAAGAFSCLFALSALAQTSSSTTQISPGATVSPTQGIGTAPANTKQGKIIDSALSAETRQTLQEAMNSVSTEKTTHPAPPAK
jgi:hypothetical protein